MQNSNKNFNLLGLMMVLSIVSNEALTVPVYANSTITGVTGNNGVYDIRPDKVDNGTGFRHYNDFRLSKDDIANLIFSKDGKNITKFVNMVDNRIYINGILNTLGNDGKFYNGNAIFVSPNGMVVGASGVLNVGSLTAIAPNTTSYLMYLLHSMPASVEDLKSNDLKEQAQTIKIDGITEEVSLKRLKEEDQFGDIRIYGKIFARDEVQLIGKNVSVGMSDKKDDDKAVNEFEEEAVKGFDKAGIMAGIPTRYDEKIATLEQANNIFDALVKNNVEKGQGFGRDSLGNVIIKAQSIKEAELLKPDSLNVKGKNYAVEKLFDVVEVLNEESNLLIKEVLPDGLTANDVKAAYITFMTNRYKVDAANPDAFDTTNVAKVNINNAVLAGKNVDVNASSKVIYDAEKGSSLFDRVVNTITNEIGETAADSFLNSIVDSTATFENFEGARANASVVIGEKSTLFAEKDVDVKSLVTAETGIKIRPLRNPSIDLDSDCFYFLGTKTASSVVIEKTANLIAGEDVTALASSRNSMNIKLKNPTSIADGVTGEIANMPSLQVSFLQEVSESETKVEVKDGAKIKAGNDVNVVASNFTSDQSVLQSVANYTGKANAGIAVAVTLKDTQVDTSAVIDGYVEAGNDININSQNMHVAYTDSKTEVDQLGKIDKIIVSKLAPKVNDVIAKKSSAVSSVLESFSKLGQKAPSASVALVVNDSEINSTAKIGKNADINANNDVKVDSAIVDMTVNTASGRLDFTPKTKDDKGTSSGSSTGTSSFIPAGSVAVVVNNQENNSVAIIEDGVKDDAGKITRAKVKAGNDIKVNATTEQPMNDSLFEFALNVTQTYEDTTNMFKDVENTQKFGFGDENWDLRVLMQKLNPAQEVAYDLKGVSFAINNTQASTLGLKGFFNNWAETEAKAANQIGISASVVVSDVINNTNARVGSYADLISKNTIVNAANSVTQFNAAGQVAKLWSALSSSAGSGIGGTVIVESTENNAQAEIGDNASVNSKDGNVDVKSANQQSYLTLAITGSKAVNGDSFSANGTTTVQEVKGKTESSIGSSTIDAQNLKVIAGEAEISKVPTSIDQLKKNHKFKFTEDLDESLFADGLEEDFAVGEIRKFTEPDVNLGIDPELGYSESDLTNVAVISGTGLAKLNDATTIKDSIKNMMVTGTLSTQSQEGTAATSSSGAAIAASINISEFNRTINALINDNSTINLAKSLNVLADTSTQSLNIAIAGSVAGGARPKKPSFTDRISNSLLKSDGIVSKIASISGKEDASTTSPTETGKFDSDGNPILKYKGENYKVNSNGDYVSEKDPNKNLTDSSGKKVSVKNLKNDGKSATTASTTESSKVGGGKSGTSKKMSAAIAGSVNVQTNKSTATAKIGKAKITVGENVNVKANQTTSAINVGGGVSKASTVGGGAAVNVLENSNSTTASVNGANINFKFTENPETSESESLVPVSNENELNIVATENNENIQVAVGVGASIKTLDEAGNKIPSFVTGDSFNADLITNSVIAELVSSDVQNNIDNKELNVTVNADNYSKSAKVAGAMGMAISSTPSMSAGAGISGNINIYDKTTKSQIDSSKITNANDVSVISNKDKTKNTEDIVDVAIAGMVQSNTRGSYSFTGATSTNIITNEITAEILSSDEDKKTEITADNVEVSAYSNHKNWSSAGALSFSKSPRGFGAGAGAIVNVLDSDIKSTIKDSTIKNAKTVKVNSYNNDELNFIAVNMGIQVGANNAAVEINGIANVIQNDISSTIDDSTIVTSGDGSQVDVKSEYKADVFGVTAVGANTTGQGLAFGTNILSNSLLSTNTASIEGNSSVESSGKTSVNAISSEKITTVPVAEAATNSGTAAVAANLGVNVVANSTKAYIDGAKVDSTGGVEVIAKDDTTSRTRGGTAVISGSGKAVIGGSVFSDTYVKDVVAYIDNSTITDGGDIDVSASAKNNFGVENPNSITINQIVKDVTEDTETSANLQDWDMAYDTAVNTSLNSAISVSGSILAKTVANDVSSYIGSNTKIETAKTVDVLASNDVNMAAIVGGVKVGGKAVVGGNIFSGVNVSSVNASIENGAVLGISEQVIDGNTVQTVKKVGAVNISADSSQTNRNITFLVGATTGKVVVNGALNSNIIVNETNAYIGENATIKSSDDVSVNASDTIDRQEVVAAVSASSAVVVGDIVSVGVLNNKVSAKIGTSDTAVAGSDATITADKNIKLTAKSTEDYQANIITVGASKNAAVGAVAISNTMASDVKAGIQGANVSALENVNVSATNSYNDKNKNQTTGLRGLLTTEKTDQNTSKDDGIYISEDELTAADKIPLVSVLNVSAAATGAAVAGTIVNNNVITEVDSYVNNSIVESGKGLNLDATSSMTTYDAVMGVGAVGTGAAVALNGVINTYSGTTQTEVNNSTITGNLDLNSIDSLNLNTVIFTVSANGTGAAVIPVINTNTIKNNVFADVINSTIHTASTVSVLADNTIKITDGVVAGSGNGTGAAVNVVPITNVFTGKTRASIQDKTEIYGTAVATSVNANNVINDVSAIVGLSGNAMGAAVGGYVATNVFDNDLDAYIDSSQIENASSTTVKANSDLDMTSLISAGSANGIGAGVVTNVLTNVLKNNVNSRITNSAITGGNINVDAIQDAYIYSSTFGTAGNAIGNGTAVNSLVNVFKNKLNSYISDTETDVNAITVKTTAIENIDSTNVGFVASGTSAVNANSIVNVLENDSYAYIDSASKEMKANRKVKVSSDDSLTMKTQMGTFVGAGVSVGANINVNVINNTAKAEILSSQDKKINVGGLDVSATSTMALEEKFLSAAYGMSGVAGNVIINSIGSKVNSHDKDELSKANISSTVSAANKNYKDANVADISYEKDGKTKNLENEYTLMTPSQTGTSKQDDSKGTIANVNANIKSSADININAENTVKGVGNDTLKITNDVVGAGTYAIGASVLVNDIDYNTAAKISGGTLDAQNNALNVNASSTLNAEISTKAATIAAVGIAGNVGYLKNSALTEAIIKNTDILNADMVDVNSTSSDNININVASKTASEASANISVGIAETNNNVNAGILGSVDIKANDITIVADNTSTLQSETDSMWISGLNFATSVNRAKSNATTQALIDATGNIVANNDLSTIAQSGGIDSTVTMNMGSVTLAGFSTTSNGASVTSSFKAGIDNTKFNAVNSNENTLSISSGTTNIKSGVLSSDNTKEATVNAKLVTDKSEASVLSTSITNLSATVDVDSTAISNANTHKADDVFVVSKLDRKASVESSEKSLGVISINALNINSKVEGTNTITIGGAHTITNNLDIDLVDKAETNTEMLNAQIKLIGTNVSSSTSIIDTDTKIDFGGNVLANNVDILSDATRTSKNSLDSKDVGFISVNKYKFNTKTEGDSAVNISANMNNSENVNDLYANKLSVTSKTDNKASSILGSQSNMLIALSEEVSENVISSKNNINFTNADINSAGTVTAKVDDNNRTSMEKDSSNSGIVVYIAGDLKNTITQNSGININNSNIIADAIGLETISALGNIDNKEITYKLRATNVEIEKTKASIDNNVTQNAKISIDNSNLAANKDMNIDVLTSSNFIQSVTNEGQGFVAKSNADSILTVTNNNDLSINGNSVLSANNVNISLDSNNTLKSLVNVKVSHLGGLDPVGKADLTLNINNNINNQGSINAGDSVQIDFLKSSDNKLTQSSDVEVEAAVATGYSKGTLKYEVKNAIDVTKNLDDTNAKEAKITAGRDVIVNYTAGKNKLSANNHLKKTHRILFGIPIKKESTSQNIVQNITNSLKLNGEIVAGNSAKRYMLIDKDGNVDIEQMKGFLETEYKIVNAATLTSEKLTAETQAALQAKIDEYNEKIESLKATKDSYDEEINEYKANISTLQSLQTYLKNVNSTIKEEDVLTGMQNNIKNAIVSAKDDEKKISETVYNDIITKYETSSSSSLQDFLNSYVVTPEVKDSNGNITQAEVKLTSKQINNFVEAVNNENAKIKSFEIGETVYASTYDDKLIAALDSDLTALKSEVDTSINSLNNHKSALESYSQGINYQISDYETLITASKNQIDYLATNPLDGYTIDKSSIQFENLIVPPSKVELNSIENTSITGNGNFKTYSPNLIIDNYSDRDLVFKTIDLASASSAGLFINGKSYSEYQNTLKPVNKQGLFSTIADVSIGTDVHYISDDGVDSSNINNVIINNFYDNSNPSIIGDAVASDIKFSGYISAPNKLEIFNDSGDISFANQITSKSKNIIATKGSVGYDANKTTLILNVDDQILAGENVDIVAKEIVLNGKIQAGYASKSITITDNMLNNLAIDPVTGERNMLNLGLGNRPTDLNAANNIKALYKDGKILLFNTKQEGGSVNLSGSVTGNGAILYTNGYATVNIDNQTSKQLVVNTLENNRMNGTVATVPSTITVTNQAALNNKATTKIASKGLIDIIGSIFNGKNKQVNDETSELTIESENGIKINDKLVKVGEVEVSLPTIDAIGDVKIKNSNSSVYIDGIINVADGDLIVENNGTNTTINTAIENADGDITISNANGKLDITNNATITNKNGDITLINSGENGTQISGAILDEIGNISITNNAGELNVNTSLTANSGNISSINNGDGGTVFTSNAKVSAKGSDSKIEITNTNGEITVAEGSEIINESQTSADNVKISNSGKGLLSVFGSIFNKKGNTVVENTNAESGVLVATTGIIKNEDGNISILNKGTQDINLEGKIENKKGNITVSIENSDLVIGEYASDNDNYITAKDGNVVINQVNGSVLNGITDTDAGSKNQNHDLGNIDKAYKTLINTNGNLAFNIQNGNVGSDTNALSGKKSGFGVNASTRDYTESINVNVKGTVSANATDSELFNLRAKDSNLNIDNITSDGNVVITASDWKQADVVPTPNDENYYRGYSVINASTDDSKANITGKNISIIASDTIGSDSRKLTYNQLENGSISALSENDINLLGLGAKDTIWQLISKRGNIDFTLNGDAEIREITAGGNLNLTSNGKNLTIYDLGKISNLTSSDDILYPHDGISIDDGDVTPQQIELKVLGKDSTLNIYNAYVKGSDNGNIDVVLRADNIIAHAYDAPITNISTQENPSGFDAKAGRTYANDITDKNATKDLKASGFNTVGDGKALTFDIQGVSQSDVIANGNDVDSRDYNIQNPVQSPKPDFQNPNAFKKPVAKSKKVSISVNSGENSPTNNRGITIEKLYADNAYVDTKDLNLKSIDTYISNYGEFVNGNRGATTGGHTVDDSYRWRNIVDNDYKRNLANLYDIPITSQLYTEKTGSFSLDMGDKITQHTKAPIVHYNMNNVISNPDTENSFFRLTYKDNKIQYVTTTPDFEEIDKSTYLPNKREFIRFAVFDDEGIVQVADKDSAKTSRIISVKDISRGGLLVLHDGSLKLNEKLSINLSYNDISTNVDVEVVRLNANSQAGLKFINMDKATANKILHMNMSLQANKGAKVIISSK